MPIVVSVSRVAPFGKEDGEAQKLCRSKVEEDGA